MRKTPPIAVVLLVLSVTLSQIPTTVHALTWSPPTPVLVDWKTNLFPDILQTSSGDIWLAWQKTSGTEPDDIYLMVNNGFGWSGQIPLVTEGFHDVTPVLAQLRNGTIVMVWSSDRSGNYDLYTMSHTAGQWSNPVPLVQATGDDFNPKMSMDQKGRLWLVWSRETATNGGGDIYYRIFNGLSWETENPLVTGTGTGPEKFPSIAQAKDGKTWLLWTVYDQIWHRTFNGVSWTQPSQLTTTNRADKWPSIAQDRAGTIWVFWSRELSSSDPTRPYQWDLHYKTSADNGVTWTPDTPIATETASDDWHPTITQGRDKRLWLAWNSDRPTQYGTQNLYLLNTDQIIVHDLAVRLDFPEDKPRIGETFTTTAIVENIGDYTEAFALTVTVDSQAIGSGNGNLSPGQSSSFTFSWPTEGKPLGSHDLRGSINVAAGEKSPWDNNLSTKLHLLPAGDVRRDGIVDVLDLVSVGTAFSSRVGDPNYNPQADLNHDDKVNILDLVPVGSTFGQKVTLPPDFNIIPSKYYHKLDPGATTTLSITVGSISGLRSPVLLSFTGHTDVATAMFSIRLVTPPGTSTLTLTASPTALPGSYTLTISGTNGTMTRSADIYLTFKP